MNILFVADVSIANVIGGAERVLFQQGTHLARRGHNIQILTRYLPHHKESHEVVQSVREWRYKVNRNNAISFLRTTCKNSKVMFDSLYNQSQFDIIIFHQPFSAIGVIKSSLSKTIKKIYTCHSLSFEEFISRNEIPKSVFGISYWLNVFIRRWIEKKVMASSDEIIVLSQFTKNKLVKTYHIPGEKITIIPGGVDLEKFQPTEDKNEIRRKLSLPENKIILFTVRNLVQRMGLGNLMEALAGITKSVSDIYMVIGGDGPLRKELEVKSEKLKVKEFVRFEGFIPEELLPDYYRMADLFVLPTKELEGFGLVTLEAMASGVPVLGTPVCGTKEILGKFDPTFLFKDTSASSMAELIMEKYRTIKEKPDEWKKISKKCRQFVEENYSWERHVDALEKHF